MRKLLVLLVLLLLGCDTDVDKMIVKETPGITDYYIEAELSGDSLIVDETIYYYNDKADFDEIRMNVYPAAGRNDVNIFNVKVEDEEVEFQLTGTVLSFDLNETLYVGEDLKIEINYSFPYWPEGRLAEYDGDYVTMFFYPYVAYYDDGWQTDAYSFRGEAYYNDVGNYFVQLTLPSKYVLATGGVVLEETNSLNKTTYEIELLNARDYSFSFSEDYSIYIQQHNDIELRIYSLGALTSLEERNLFGVMKSVMDYTEEYVGDYPYPVFTAEFGHIYGMESTSIVYCSRDISEITLIHEMYHQWFFAIIGGDQASTPWLDEGVTSFMTGLYYIDNRPDWAEGYWEHYDVMNPRYDSYRDDYLGDSALEGVHDYPDTYGLMVYVYGANVLKKYMDEQLNGDSSLMLEVMKNYYDTYKFEEPTVDEFLTLLEETTEIEGSKEWFYDYLLSFQTLEN